MKGEKTVLLGDFDGVHIGHRAIVSEGVRIRERTGLPVTVWTFDAVRAEALTTLEDRIAGLKEAGADEVLLCDFESVRDMSCRSFVTDVLKGGLNARQVVCGYNYSFGRGGRGTPELLTDLCREQGIGVSVLDEVRVEGREVSSSEIRRLIREGDMRTAAKLLGRPWSCRGAVERGAGLGRTVGMPTVNLGVKGLVLPKHGVYATVAYVGGRTLPSVTNVGVRPTLNDGRGVTVETHIINFDLNLYGLDVNVEFLDFIRDERAFSSLEELSEQVKRDVAAAEELIKTLV